MREAAASRSTAALARDVTYGAGRPRCPRSPPPVAPDVFDRVVHALTVTALAVGAALDDHHVVVARRRSRRRSRRPPPARFGSRELRRSRGSARGWSAATRARSRSSAARSTEVASQCRRRACARRLPLASTTIRRPVLRSIATMSGPWSARPGTGRPSSRMSMFGLRSQLRERGLDAERLADRAALPRSGPCAAPDRRSRRRVERALGEPRVVGDPAQVVAALGEFAGRVSEGPAVAQRV